MTRHKDCSIVSRCRCSPAANDNDETDVRINATVMTLARLLGRRIAQEEYTRLRAANDNRPIRREACKR